MSKQRCGSCRFFEDANLAGSGWCHHPQRKTTSDLLIMVRRNELACRDEWSHSLWESGAFEPAARRPSPAADRRVPPASESDIAAVLRAHSASPTEDVVLGEARLATEPPSAMPLAVPPPAQPVRPRGSLLELDAGSAIKRARETYRERNRALARNGFAGAGTNGSRAAPDGPRTPSAERGPDPTPQVDDPEAGMPMAGRFGPAIDSDLVAGSSAGQHRDAESELGGRQRLTPLDPTPGELSVPERNDASFSSELGLGANEPQHGGWWPHAEAGDEPLDEGVAHVPTATSGAPDEEIAEREAAGEVAVAGERHVSTLYFDDPDDAGASVQQPPAHRQIETPWSVATARSSEPPAAPPRSEIGDPWIEPNWTRFASGNEPEPGPEVAERPTVATDVADWATFDLPVDPTDPAVWALDEAGGQAEETDAGTVPADALGALANGDDSWVPSLLATVAAGVPRMCRTCRSFRPGDSGERGWCANQWAFTHRRLVEPDDPEPCETSLGSWWLPADDVCLAAADISTHGQPTPLLDRLLPHHRERAAERKRS